MNIQRTDEELPPLFIAYESRLACRLTPYAGLLMAKYIDGDTQRAQRCAKSVFY